MKFPLPVDKNGDINYHFVRIDDLQSEDISQFFDDFIKVISNGLQKGEGFGSLSSWHVPEYNGYHILHGSHLQLALYGVLEKY